MARVVAQRHLCSSPVYLPRPLPSSGRFAHAKIMNLGRSVGRHAVPLKDIHVMLMVSHKVLRTGLTPSASGSSYLELQHQDQQSLSLIPTKSSLKLTCTVHGPRPLPRSAPFSPQLILTTHVRFAPFAGRQRRGYVRDIGERDLGVHLEAALRGVVIGDRWPKSGVDVVITVLESEEDSWWADAQMHGKGTNGAWGMMTTLAGCITAASAALVEAGIDCVDLVSGGAAALVRQPSPAGGRDAKGGGNGAVQLVLDPCPSEHEIVAACVVGYLSSRDELTELWTSGDIGASADELIQQAVNAAVVSRSVLSATLKEVVTAQLAAAADASPEMSKSAENESAKGKSTASEPTQQQDVAMTG